MKIILEYSEFTEDDILNNLLRIQHSKLGRLINNYEKHDPFFSSYDIECLIAQGAMNEFSDLLPMDEEDEDFLWRILEDSESCAKTNEQIREEFYDFFTEISPVYHYRFKGEGLIRPIKWRKIK